MKQSRLDGAPATALASGNHYSHLQAWARAQQEVLRDAPRPLARTSPALFDRFQTIYADLSTRPRQARRRLQRQFGASLAGVALVLALGATPAARAAQIDVDTNVPDRNIGDGACSLIEAIDNANADADLSGGDCAAGSGADTIELAPNSVHTLTAVDNASYGATGLPVITSELTIAGNDATIQRDPAAPAFRILAVGTYGSNGTATLQSTTVSGGQAGTRSGGGVHVGFGFNRLTVEGSTLTGNRAANGGAIQSQSGVSRVDISDSTLSNNVATGDGGAVQARGTLSIVRSTLAGNSAGFYGGAVGGFNYQRTITVQNSTISANVARRGGGVSFRNAGSANILDSTITANTATNDGGGIQANPQYFYSSERLNVQRSIVSGNEAGTGDEISIRYPSGCPGGAYCPTFNVTSDDNVLSSAYSTTAEAFNNFTPGASDFDASSDAEDDPLVSILDTTLADNGGPTRTHALPLGSAAVDGAGAACPATDQRGETRPQGAACDAGAFELQVVDTDGDGVPDGDDLCPGTPMGEPVDAFGCADVQVDPDLDGVCSDGAPSGGPSMCQGTDVCPDTVADAPTRGFGRNRWGLTDVAGGVFFQAPPQSGSMFQFTTQDTDGCSCSQIVVELDAGAGHTRKGCSTSLILEWIER